MTQLTRVRQFMLSGNWATLREIADACAPCSEAGASARLRDLRNKLGMVVEKERVAPGRNTWRYRVRVPATQGRLF